MKIAITIAAAAVASFGIAAPPAAAYHLSPTGTFTATGTTSATKNGITLPCTATLSGKVNSNGIGFVTGGSFGDNGGPPGACAAVTLNNLPWKAVATTSRRVKIRNVTFTTPIGACGPNTLPVQLKNGVITFTTVAFSNGSCTVSGNLTTSPTLSIVP